jgi:hypothetical protein
MRNRVVAGDDDVDWIEIAEIGDFECDVLTEPSSLASRALDRPLADVRPENAVAVSSETDRLCSDPTRAIKNVMSVQPSNPTNQLRNRQALVLDRRIPILETEGTREPCASVRE